MELETMARSRRPEITTRYDWRKSEGGCWSLSLGERGCRVRVFQRQQGGVFIRATWVVGRGWREASLQTTSRVEAKARAEAFLRALLVEEAPPAPRPVTLGELWIQYQQEAPAYRANTKRVQEEKASRIELLQLGLGTTAEVERLTLADCARYAELRRRGTGWPDGRDTGKVRDRTVAQDLALLRTVIRWGCTVRRPNGSWLVAENPLRGLRLPVEQNPARPVATHDRFLAVRKVMGELARAAGDAWQREQWVRLELALVLAEATGRRLGAIRGLRWADVAQDPPAITWRAEYDKRRREQTVPIPAALADDLRAMRAKLLDWGDGWLFPQRSKDQPWERARFDKLLREAESLARDAEGKPLTHLPGGLWHPYRRKWASERRHLPAVDVMKAGGWKNRTVMETCYQHADDAGVLEVMSSAVKLRDRKLGGSA